MVIAQKFTTWAPPTPAARALFVSGLRCKVGAMSNALVRHGTTVANTVGTLTVTAPGTSRFDFLAITAPSIGSAIVHVTYAFNGATAPNPTAYGNDTWTLAPSHPVWSIKLPPDCSSVQVKYLSTTADVRVSAYCADL